MGHASHMEIAATKRLLRLRFWFPGMDEVVEKEVKAWLACQVAISEHLRDPLKSCQLPDGQLGADRRQQTCASGHR